MMQSMTPNLMVHDVNKTIEFYRDVLGFEFVASVPDSGQFDWAMMKHGPVEIMFQSAASLAKDLPTFVKMGPGGAFTLFIKMEDSKSFYGKVKGKAEIVQELTKTFYDMEEFSIKDLDGYILTFATPTK
jgi:uncharacterized glyoxalase superfamily protein PhnB